MRFALLALGSRGDVQPFIALALALHARGHQVRLLCAPDYTDLADAYAVPTVAVGGAIADLMDHTAVLAALDAAQQPLPLGFARRFVAQVATHLPPLASDALYACQGAQVIIASTLGTYLAEHLAERLSVPVVPVHFHPVGPTRTLPDVNLPAAPRWLPLAGAYHRLSHLLTPLTLRQLLHAPLNQMRTAVLGLRPRSRWHAWRAAHITPPLTLYGFSEQLCPRPNDWPVSRVVCGTWLLPAPPEFTPPPELVQFLAAGPPPVYIGFGSILAGRDPAGLVYQLLAALAQAGQRGIIYRGAWGDLAVGDLPPQVMRCAEVPHAWLFPQVAAVVTHGGAGTVAAALAAGVPPIVVAAFGDQHLWGQRVAALGAGPPPLRRDTLTASTLAAAIRTATETITLRTTATALGAALVAEAGALQAAVQLEQLALPATI